MKGDDEDLIRKLMKDVTEKQFSCVLIFIVFSLCILAILGVLFVGIQSFLLTSSSLKHSLLIAAVGFGLDYCII